MSGLTADEDEATIADLDGLFPNGITGIDADDMAAIRQLASIAQPHDSSWGKEFFEGDPTGVSPFTLKSVTGTFDPTLSAGLNGGATSGPLSYFSASLTGGDLADQYSIASPGGSAGNGYGGAAGGGASGGNARQSSASIATAVNAGPVAVPEPTTLSLLGLAGLTLLQRRRTR